MQNSDIEKFYHRIDSHIKLVQSHTGINNISEIIKNCRLKPYNIFTNSFKKELTYENHWADEFGNSLLIENKIPKIILGNTQLPESTKISTDLFFGNSIKSTIDNSKLIFIATGNYFGKDFIFTSLYGNDEYLRTFINYNKWYRVSPLFLGLNTINTILNYKNNSQPIEIDKKQLDFILPLNIKRCVIIALPIKKDIPIHFSVVLNSIT
jgi:hypothetical protein